MDASLLDSQWIWHPLWVDQAVHSAGAFVHFRKTFSLNSVPVKPVYIQITADTRYKLYINQQLVAFGPVKGDERLWFYDELDIQPHLQPGINHISVRVLRFYYATPWATSFPRLPQAGLLIRSPDPSAPINLKTDSTWEAAIDRSIQLPTDITEDDFLHIYEEIVAGEARKLQWTSAKELAFEKSHGLTMPWQLSKRMIPTASLEQKQLLAVHNLSSTQSEDEWAGLLLSKAQGTVLRLPRGTSHHIELEVDHHVTAFLWFRFVRPSCTGSRIKITYSEAYENTPHQIPYLRDKDDRRDTKKTLMGPYDRYTFMGIREDDAMSRTHEQAQEMEEEVFAPFHFRTFRFMALDIEVDPSCDLVMLGIDLTVTKYPLDVLARFSATRPDESTCRELWQTSIRTLENCMHDCYEDCPFYEQFQYAMDTRSSALFTYSLSSDDRLARQAIIQLHTSYNAATGLTCSRAPSHQAQIIPSFSLFWILLITDHFTYFNDATFTRRFLAECDGVLSAFARRIDPTTGLIRCLSHSTQWDFVDWTNTWRPFGIPPAGERTGFLSHTNMLYAYTLQQLVSVLVAIDRPGLAGEYTQRAARTITALQTHCFDGVFFTDGLAHAPPEPGDYSQHSQIWAVLCGAATGDVARSILAHSLSIPTTATAPTTRPNHPAARAFTPASLAMSFYTLRALSLASRTLYTQHFQAFWAPWRAQLAQNLDTWCEDSVSQRSDCHAWGSTPCYEFVAEVAGVTPGAPGWAVIDFQPRVELAEELDVTVPFGGRKGAEGAGIARVRWWRSASRETANDMQRQRKCECGKTRVVLSLEWHVGEARDVAVRVVAPDGTASMRSGLTELEFWFCDVSCLRPSGRNQADSSVTIVSKLTGVHS